MAESIVLADSSLEVLSKILNRQVANFNVLYVKLHHYHWYVKGPHFFELHEKFEQLYDELTQHMDDVAERLLTIGGKPLSTMRDFLQETTLKEAAGNERAEQMVQAVHDDLSQIACELKEGMKQAEDENDYATADLLLGIQSSLEKHIWMYRAFLGK
jgi:starvation-inducible DNA-binding protein